MPVKTRTASAPEGLKAILQKLMKLGRETGNEHLVAYHPKTGRQIWMSSLGVQRRAGPASRLVPLDQVRVEISRRSVPKKLEGRYDEQSVAKSVELPLMELLVQLPAQPDPQGDDRQRHRHKPPEFTRGAGHPEPWNDLEKILPNPAVRARSFLCSHTPIVRLS